MSTYLLIIKKFGVLILLYCYNERKSTYICVNNFFRGYVCCLSGNYLFPNLCMQIKRMTVHFNLAKKLFCSFVKFLQFSECICMDLFFSVLYVAIMTYVSVANFFRDNVCSLYGNYLFPILCMKIRRILHYI